MDNVTQVLANINRSIDKTVSAFEEMDGTSGASFSEARASIVRTKGQLEQLNTSLAKNNTPLKQQSTLWSDLKRKITGAVGAYVGFQSVKSLIGLSDTISQTTARLNMMNDGLQTTNELSKMIYDSAGRSRGEYLATADAVSKLGTMAGDAFKSSKEIIDFAEQVNKQFMIAGTSVEGQSAAWLQLTQAMGSGVLRGEELNSILEQAPNIVQTIADYLDKPKGAIKDLAAEGKITSDIVKEAMFASADETNKKFDSMPKTFGQTWLEIKNAAIKSFEEISTQLSAALNSEQVTAMVDGIISVLPGAMSVLSEFLGYVMKVGSFIADHWGAIAPIVGAVASGFLAFKAVTGVADTIKKVTDSIETFKTAAQAIKGGGGILSALSLGPVGAIVIGLAAAVTAIILLWKNCEGFRNAVKKIWSTVRDAFITAWTAITDFFTITVPGAFRAVLNFFKSIPGFFVGLWNKVQTAFSDAWNAIASNPVMRAVVTTVTRIWNNAKTTLAGIWNGIKMIASGAWTMIKNVILGPILLLIDLVTGNFTKLKTDALAIWNNIKAAAGMIWNGVKTVILSAAQGIVNHARILWTGFLSITQTIFGGIKQFFITIWSAIKNFVVRTVTGIKTGAVNGFQSMITGIRTRVSKIKSTVVNGFKGAIDYIQGLPAKALKWGRDFIDGLIKGIKDKIGAVGDAVSGIADKIREFLHFSRPDVGPLREYETWMPDFMRGLSQGILKNKGSVIKQVKDLTARMRAASVTGVSVTGQLSPIPVSSVKAGNGSTNKTDQSQKNVYISVTVQDEGDEDRLIKKLRQILEEGAYSGAEGVYL